MGHGHHEFPEIPDFRKYVVEDVPDLLATKRRLASMGLKDPWLRNEVWRYQVGPTYKNSYRLLGSVIFTGFKYGVLIAIGATAISKTFRRKVQHH